ncbi:MAG: hypothetical protein OXH99_15345 [Bryobacterales bacterium]|nr:hypothetical protein [Bryobacterales bacterium]
MDATFADWQNAASWICMGQAILRFRHPHVRDCQAKGRFAIDPVGELVAGLQVLYRSRIVPQPQFVVSHSQSQSRFLTAVSGRLQGPQFFALRQQNISTCVDVCGFAMQAHGIERP